MMFTKRNLILSILLIIPFLSSCARRVDISPAEIVKRDQYAYVRDHLGRWFIVTSNSKALDEAMKHIHPGPSSVDKLDLWIITPLNGDKN